MSSRLAKREFTRLGGKTYVVHTYSDGTLWMIMHTCVQITAVRVLPGHAGSDHSHHFRRPPAGDRTPAGGAQ